MQTHITREWGSKEEIPNGQKDEAHRSQHYGRRAADESDHQHLMNEKIPENGGSPNTLPLPMSDSDATVLHVQIPQEDSTSDLKAPPTPKPKEEFEITPLAEKPSGLHEPVVADQDSSLGSKVDLSERVMRPIAKPAAPLIPYAGASGYGIHRFLRLHQKGGMGRILAVYDQYLKREVALKELHADVAEDESIVKRFIGEAEITAQLEHPGIVPIYRLGLGKEGHPYYTMKMIKGKTLQDLIKAYHRKPNRPELMNLVRRLVSVAKTMAFSHDKGVTHRDLKPANVMVGEYGETLVMDWGLAKMYNQGAEDSYISIVHRTKQPRPELTMVGSIVGTPAFMSPEQAMADENAVGPLSDVFSLGTVLYYLLTGQTAFSGRSTQEVLEKVRACNPMPPSQVKPGVPRGLEAICLKAIEKLPEKRYQGATEFADDLCRWLDGEPVLAEHPSLFSTIRRWSARYRSWLIGIPSVLLLSAVLTWISVSLLEQPPKGGGQNVDGAVDPAGSGQEIPTEFKRYFETTGKPEVQVSHSVTLTGELLLVCQVKTMKTDAHRVISLSVPPEEPWNLADRHFLTFSLLTVSDTSPPLLNFSLRLGQGTGQKKSYYEFVPEETSWETRNLSIGSRFTVPLRGSHDDWKCKIVGDPAMETIEWIEIHFDSDSEMTLIFEHFKFCGK
ncbi:MAG: serine/threonine protein kinase [Planctomycetaceae bacterium]|jgi:serine/threonine protein kinase|nr:serine/threonine protein kinase [Planctomycetaceae bacterium]